MSPIRKPRGLPLAAAILSAAVLCACAVGPNFKRPAAPTVSDYTSARLGGTSATPNTSAGEAQRFLKGGDVAGDWWTLYHSQPLDELIEQSLVANPDLGAARAALSVARENVLSQRGAYYPSLTAGFSAIRQRQSGQIAPTPNSESCSSTTCSRRRSRLLRAGRVRPEPPHGRVAAGAGGRGALPDDRDLHTLTSNVVVTAIQEAALEQQIEGDARSGRRQQARCWRSCGISSAKGYASRLDVAAQEIAARAGDRDTAAARQAARPAARPARGAARAVSPPSRPAAHFELTSLTLPQDLPVSLPSALVEQRPDVLPGRSEPARRERQDRHRHREPPAEHHADRPTPAARRSP